jgi:tRNA modification GTPase
MDRLVAAIERFADHFFATGEAPVVTRQRHREILGVVVGTLRRAAEAGPEEFVAEELRLAARALERLTGRIDVEDVLDVIFRDFCIGK